MSRYTQNWMYDIVKQYYPNDTWAAKVDKMPPRQVFAIYRAKNSHISRTCALASVPGSSDSQARLEAPPVIGSLTEPVNVQLSFL